MMETGFDASVKVLAGSAGRRAAGRSFRATGMALVAALGHIGIGARTNRRRQAPPFHCRWLAEN